jgi:transcriptional regulator with XRE-family HTH domain
VSAIQSLIQAAIDAQGLKVADIARKAGLTDTLIYGWLNGSRIIKTPMRPDTVAGLAKGLGVPEVVVWQACLTDLGSDVRMIPDDMTPEKAVLIASIAKLPESQVNKISTIVQAFMDED